LLSLLSLLSLPFGIGLAGVSFGATGIASPAFGIAAPGAAGTPIGAPGAAMGAAAPYAPPPQPPLAQPPPQPPLPQPPPQLPQVSQPQLSQQSQDLWWKWLRHLLRKLWCSQPQLSQPQLSQPHEVVQAPQLPQVLLLPQVLQVLHVSQPQVSQLSHEWCRKWPRHLLRKLSCSQQSQLEPQVSQPHEP
jgi:hypothetical protein